jgi:peptidoglycan hydrolase-like protein with peptidoglycan-binding domain
VSFVASVTGAGATLLRHRVIAATAAAATAVLVAGCAFAATSSTGSGQEKLASVSDSKAVRKTTAKPVHSITPAAPLHVISMTPSGGHHVNGGDAIVVTFSSPLASSTPLPTLSPSIAGSWKVSGVTATFTPSSGYLPGTTVTLKVPGGRNGMTAAATSAGVLKKASSVTFTTGTYSTLRMQELLTQLGYLPLHWTPKDQASGTVPSGNANAQVRAAYDAPDGTFTFTSGYPSALTSQWQSGTDNIMVNGAVRAFEYNQGLAMDGDAGPEVWATLLTAVAKDQANPNGYTYALATQDPPHETLRVWHDGKVILDTPANTGVPGATTADGTFPVYLKYQVTQMKGLNPDGTKYDDTVYWVSYFNGGDAVHYFPRYGYGYYQSDGCVEIQLDPAKFIWSYLTYGTLVTVQGQVA